MRAVAAVLREAGSDPVLEEVSLAAPLGREVVVRMVATGICHTDLAAARGLTGLALPVVLGHEGAGVVCAVGDEVTRVAPGDHVVLSYDRCEACATCAAGRFAYCERFNALNNAGLPTLRDAAGDVVHGAFLGQSSFATYALASERNAVVVPRDVLLEPLGPLGCSLLTGAGAVLEVLRPAEGASIAVFGLGSVGLAGVMAAAAAGCARVVGVDPDPARRALAEELGATETHAPGARLRGLEHALETVGTEEVVGAALGALRSPGTAATVGFRGPRNLITVDQGRLLFGRTLTGVIEGDADPHELLPRLIALHREGRFPLDRLTTPYPFAEIGRALADARAGTVVKPVLVF